MVNISAIDVGSNAMRMVVGEVDESWRVNPIENTRLPVRLEPTKEQKVLDVQELLMNNSKGKDLKPPYLSPLPSSPSIVGS